MSISREPYAVAVVGAGVVGSAAALALAELGLSVVLIEAREPQSVLAESGYDPRVMALNGSSRQLLEQLGVWSLIGASHITGYQAMQVWDGDGSGRIEFTAARMGLAELGAIVEQQPLLDALQQRLAAVGVNVERPASVVAAVRCNGVMRLQLADGRTIATALLVAADGAQSPLRERLGFATRSWSYGQDAIITTVTTSRPHSATAYQRFTAHGPLALLPLGGDDQRHCSLVWSQSSGEAARLMALDDGDFCRELTLASEQVLGVVSGCDRRYRVALTQRHAVDYVQPNVALIGDAAHTIHPLAGQGVNLGLKDVAALAAVAGQFIAAGGAPAGLGDAALLGRYQRRRQPDNLATMAAMEGLKRLFGSAHPLLRLARNWGLSQFDRTGPVKKWLVRIATGQ